MQIGAFVKNSILKHCRGWWLALVLLALLPIWIVGMFDRGMWTPDEPREADIVWRMTQQADHTLPQLANTPFLEKPPLSYWLSAAAVHVFGDSPKGMRAPNLMYAIIVAFAIGLLVRSMAGWRAAVVAALVAGSTFEAYRVGIWLAPDACLAAGCAIALLGAYRGYVACEGHEKLFWYTLMHAGAAAGFMAKSGPGWIVPGLALFGVIVWERHWRELRRWQLWAGAVLQAFVIGAWIHAVWQEPDGAAALRVFFWNNLAGRFADIHAAGALNYASSHKNWPGKYFVELPYYLFPWLLLVLAALRRAWGAIQIPGVAGTPWRFAVSASMPFLILLSVAATARDVYFTPVVLGLSMLVGLWFKELYTRADRFDILAVRGTGYFVTIFCVLLVAILTVLAVASRNNHYDVLSCAAGVIVIGVVTTIGLVYAKRARHLGMWSQWFGWIYIAFATSLAGGGMALLPVVDRWQNLGMIVREVRHDTGNGVELALLQPDETTIAMMDYQAGVPILVLDGDDQSVQHQAADWLHQDNGRHRILVKLSGSGAGEINRQFIHQQVTENDGLMVTRLAHAGVARVVARYELPQGRRYALLGPMS
ncbi:MAG: ArnT family glycosyltransferase [Steroidobacteraceae bacterium]